jgi:hypothetical protein
MRGGVEVVMGAKTVLAGVIIFVMVIAAFAQAPDTLWTRTYGGRGDEVAYCVKDAPGGGYIVAGYTNSYGAGGKDCFLVKVDNDGDTLWTRTYGENLDDIAYSVCFTSDDGYILGGNNYNYWYLVKVDSVGNVMWTRRAPFGWDRKMYSMQVTNDDGYIMTGFNEFMYYLSQNFWFLYGLLSLRKLDSDGEVEWSRNFGTMSMSNYHLGRSVKQTRDGGYIITGRKEWMKRFWLIKTNSSGQSIWETTVDIGRWGYGYDVIQATDSEYVAVGYLEYYNENNRALMVKTDAEGDTLWTRQYDGDHAASIQHTNDGGYILAGWKSGTAGDGKDCYVVKTNTLGDTMWTAIYGGTFQDEANSIIQDSEGSYVIAGFTVSFGAGGSDIYLVKTEPIMAPPSASVGISSDSLHYGGVCIGEQASRSLTLFNYGDTTLTLYDVYTDDSCFIVEYVPSGSVIYPEDSLSLSVLFAPDAPGVYNSHLYIDNSDELAVVVLEATAFYGKALSPESFCLHNPYPNPFNAVVAIPYDISRQGKVRVDVHDVLGRNVATLVDEEMVPGYHQISWDAGELPSGIYFVRMSARTPSGESGEFHQTRKVVLLK